MIHRSVLVLFLLSITVSAQTESIDIDESAMFSDTVSIVSDTVASAIAVESKLADIEKVSVGFSGNVTAAGDVSILRDTSIWEVKADSTAFGSSIVGNVDLDVRLPKGVKAFASAEVSYAPRSDSTPHFTIPEMFVDLNIAHRVYLRAGRQVLQWGRCYFFNPVDMVNVEKKSFLTKLQSRVGTYGIKAHVPFGTVVNVYGFVDANKYEVYDYSFDKSGSVSISLDSIQAPHLKNEMLYLAGAGKIEVLVGGVESSLSLWQRKGKSPVFGFDISGTLPGKVIFSGECALTKGERGPQLDSVYVTSVTIDPYTQKPLNHYTAEIHKPGKDIIPRFAIGINRAFDFLDVKDRINLFAEYFYNGEGYDKNLFDGNQMQQMVLLSKFYEQNAFRHHYLALFGTVSKFILPDVSLSVNAIGNLEDGSGVVSGGLSYASLHGLSVGLTLNGFYGDKNTEYAFFGTPFTARLTAGVSF